MLLSSYKNVGRVRELEQQLLKEADITAWEQPLKFQVHCLWAAYLNT